MADDSGLEVDALDKQPGIHSARWSQMHPQANGDLANNALLLEQLNEVPDENRTARFVCVLAISDPCGNVMWTTRDTMEGRIGRAPVGKNGFGYDPLFRVQGLNRTSAELTPAEKNSLSHRGKALRRMKHLLHGVDLQKVAK